MWKYWDRSAALRHELISAIFHCVGSILLLIHIYKISRLQPLSVATYMSTGWMIKFSQGDQQRKNTGLQMSRDVRKHGIGVSTKVRHKPGPAIDWQEMAKSLKFRKKDLGKRGIVLSM